MALLPPAMLILGTDKTATFLEQLPKSYLLIDDGSIIDQLSFPQRRKITRLDLDTHSLNPLARMTYPKAVQLVETLLAAFPGGAETLTKEGAALVLLEAVLENKTRTLSELLPHPDKKDSGEVKASQMLRRVLLSPVLKRVLDRPTNVSLTGIVLARLDPAELGDFDAKLLGRLLIASYPGQVIIPDFGFYAIPAHSQLIRQGRLIAGVNFLSDLDRLPQLRQQLLSGPRQACGTSYDDAETLAEYARIPRGTNAYTDFIDECMRNRS